MRSIELLGTKVAPAVRGAQRMIPKSGNRFSDKIMLKCEKA